MKISLNQLMEMVRDITVGGNTDDWVLTARDVDVSSAEYWDEDDTEMVAFLINGPWEQGPLLVEASTSYLYSVALGHDYGEPHPEHVYLRWSQPHGAAQWKDIGASIKDIAKAANGSGVLRGWRGRSY